MLSFLGGSKPRKKTFRYKVVVKGVTISKHYTKKSADLKSKGIYSAKVVKLGGSSKRRKPTYRKRY